MATIVHNVTFDGINAVPYLPGQGFFPAGTSMGYYSVFVGDGILSPTDDFFDATANLTGTGWRIKTLRLAGDDNLTKIVDLDNGGGRRIDFLELGYNSDVELISTTVRHIFGWDGDKHEITLGNEHSSHTFSITLWAKLNIVTTGNRWVASIDTGGSGAGTLKDTITIGEGGAGNVNTGVGNDTVVTTSGFVRSIATNDGDDTIQTGTNFVHSIASGNGDDTVRVGGGAFAINTWQGDDKVFTTGFVDGIATGDGADVVRTGTGGAGAVTTGEGNDKVTAGTGYVTLIDTGNGNDVVEAGTGGVGFIRLAGGNDRVIVNEFNPEYGVVLQGEAGTDTIDFGKFSVGVTFTLETSAYQNVAAPAGGTGKGNVSADLFENLWGTSKGDVLTGDGSANVLLGKGGNDSLDGLAGNDKLNGAAGSDTLKGGEGRDTLLGGGGNDTLQGDGGNDTLRGQAGRDVFVFGANSGTDTVKDYADGTDKLRIADHVGGFAALDISRGGGNKIIAHDGGTIVLEGKATVTLTASDFDFV
ncbi:MAG: hypothetical protein KDK24_06300 [Pseudooceanicola sp.]|nr:hypothetical protein [Pseudooceanicola sp.]